MNLKLIPTDTENTTGFFPISSDFYNLCRRVQSRGKQASSLKLKEAIRFQAAAWL